MNHRPIFYLALLILLAACGEPGGQVPTLGTKGSLSEMEANPTGTWELSSLATGTVSTFEVSGEKIEYSGINFNKASKVSGNLPGFDLRGFLIVEDSTSPAKARVLWLRATSNGALDGESNMVVSVDAEGLLLGGDMAKETTPGSRLRRR